MSICTSCYDAGAFVDLCAESLIFGTLEEDTEYTVVMQSYSTGKIQTFAVTSDEDGYVTFIPALASNTTYEVWVTQGGANAPRENISIDSVNYLCIDFSVVSTGDEPEQVYLTPEP